MCNFLRNAQCRGILQDEGYQLLALLQIPAWVAVQYLQGAQPRSAAGAVMSQASGTSGLKVFANRTTTLEPTQGNELGHRWGLPSEKPGVSPRAS